jgi:hypothetical protein
VRVAGSSPVARSHNPLVTGGCLFGEAAAEWVSSFPPHSVPVARCESPVGLSQVTVVAEQLEVLHEAGSSRGEESLIASRHPGDGDGVDDVGLARATVACSALGE